MQVGVDAGFEAFALAALTRYKDWTKEEVLVLASKARADGRKRSIHMIGGLVSISLTFKQHCHCLI